MKTEAPAVSIIDNLLACLDGNDKLMVARLEDEAAWAGYSAQISDWVKEAA